MDRFGDTLAVQFNKTECSPVAVNVAFWFVEIVPAVAANVVEVAPAGTVMEPGVIGNNALLLDTNTSVPPLGAAPVSVTVHRVAAAVIKLVGLQTS